MKQNPEILDFSLIRDCSQWESAKTIGKMPSPKTEYTEVSAVLGKLNLRGSKRILGDKISTDTWNKLKPSSL